MNQEHHPELTSAELASLWGTYENNSVSIQMIKYALSHVEDQEIRSIFEYALSLYQQHMQFINNLFVAEQIAVPHGFSSEDVNLNAPRMYTDDFYIMYIQNLSKIGLTSYTMAISSAARTDVIRFFKKCLSSSADLLEQTTQLKLNKGIFQRAPYIPKPKISEYIHEMNYLGGGWFSDKRPLNAIEITHLYYNIERNTVGASLIMGFSQAAKSEEIRKYLTRGRDIAEKHTKIFDGIMRNDHLTIPSLWDALPTDESVSPFSDKLMMFHISIMNAAGVGQYGAAIGASQRADLIAAYTRLTAEIVKYSKDGADIMIKYGWMEKPPHAPDREQIAKKG